MPRPRSLTTRQIAAAALTVIDRDGLPALSMRTVAAELDRRTMALYRYVEDREELECLVVDLALGAVLDRAASEAGSRAGSVTGRAADPVADPVAGPRARLLALLESMREAVGAHPGVLPLAVRHHGGCPSALRWRERLLAALADAGLAGPRRAAALHALVAYVIGALELEHQAAADATPVGPLVPETFPLLAEALAVRAATDPARAFTDGARTVLDGLGLDGLGLD
ncbi:TetR/AcrR family transcriptional regulator C-terminal domain-containing protein [Kitasatospora sp. NA04385]|uniref:TetR/AcrR family transcriptional regulator n=1 Tax=Kitasatospora sp. NA04385 TaxID=2742135 RepID=UPI00159022B7|nr:TetR/AcrR family transcriptional regulator C-terminal domain-containing protein [Kitasatospora sp. NA04385]QKW22892.1 TetR/AcrR family transcriptional regulator C-terminal domain-containing protein [Kitasatospora sp. NA04385]